MAFARLRRHAPRRCCRSPASWSPRRDRGRHDHLPFLESLATIWSRSPSARARQYLPRWRADTAAGAAQHADRGRHPRHRRCCSRSATRPSQYGQRKTELVAATHAASIAKARNEADTLRRALAEREARATNTLALRQAMREAEVRHLAETAALRREIEQMQARRATAHRRPGIRSPPRRRDRRAAPRQRSDRHAPRRRDRRVAGDASAQAESRRVAVGGKPALGGQAGGERRPQTEISRLQEQLTQAERKLASLQTQRRLSDDEKIRPDRCAAALRRPEGHHRRHRRRRGRQGLCAGLRRSVRCRRLGASRGVLSALGPRSGRRRGHTQRGRRPRRARQHRRRRADQHRAQAQPDRRQHDLHDGRGPRGRSPDQDRQETADGSGLCGFLRASSTRDATLPAMPAFICNTCGTQYEPSDKPPAACPICDDERQYVPPTGQAWTTLESLRLRFYNAWRELEPDLISITTAPAFGIGQRAQLLRTPDGNILWDCIALVDNATVELIKAHGRRQGHRDLAPALLHHHDGMEPRARRRADPSARGRQEVDHAQRRHASSCGAARRRSCCPA